MPAPGSLSGIIEDLSKYLLIERMPCVGHSAGKKDGEGVSPFSQGTYNIVGQRRPGHKYSIRLYVTGGIISEIFEMGLKGCWEDLPNDRPVSAKGESMWYLSCLVNFKLSRWHYIGVMKCWEVRLETFRWLKVLSLRFFSSNDRGLLKVPDALRTVWESGLSLL